MSKFKLSPCQIIAVAIMMAASGTSIGQEVSLVSPSAFEEAEAPNSLVPIPGGDGRVQILYEASDFSSLTGPHWITHFAWRPDGSITQPFTAMADSIVFRMSTTDKTASNMSLTFAENVGPDETIVLETTASVTAPVAGPAGGPKDFTITWELDAPFLYDPGLGSLLLDFDLDNGSVMPADNLPLPAQSSTTKWIVGPLGGATAGNEFGGIITQFTFRPIPEPSSFLLLVLGLGVAIAVGRRWSTPIASSQD